MKEIEIKKEKNATVAIIRLAHFCLQKWSSSLIMITLRNDYLKRIIVETHTHNMHALKLLYLSPFNSKLLKTLYHFSCLLRWILNRGQLYNEEFILYFMPFSIYIFLSYGAFLSRC